MVLLFCCHGLLLDRFKTYVNDSTSIQSLHIHLISSMYYSIDPTSGCMDRFNLHGTYAIGIY